MEKIFPAAVLEQTSEYYQNKIAVRSRIIYLSTLTFLLLTLAGLPFIKVDVSVQARGVLQSALERNELFVPVAGRISKVHFSENQKVKKGQVLAEIETQALDLELESYTQRLGTLNDYLHDLDKLRQADVKSATGIRPQLKTSVYAAAYYEFFSGYESLQAQLEKATRDFERNKALHEAQAISFTEFDETRLRYEQATAGLQLQLQKQLAQWEQEANAYTRERQELQNKARLLDEQKRQFRVVAGVDGTLLQVKNIKEGDYVFPNQKIAEISPDAALQAVAYLSPKDIGLVRPGQQVSFQVDAFNYNDWGLAQGTVLEISDDLAMLSEQQAVFRVLCRLDQEYLSLQNGYRGRLKKGMSFNGRFLVARRSLYQLLFDKLDNWMNPTTHHNPAA